MKDSQILSVFHETKPGPDPVSDDGALVFDACQMGVVLRSVLFVEVAVGVACMFVTLDFVGWLLRASLVTAGALPATLSWLLLACLSKRWLARFGLPVQYTCAVALGALAGVYGCGVLAFAGFLASVPWVSSACAGALLSAVLVVGLVLRAKGRMPADAAARLTELQSRIRPHFLFNTLNSAIALVRAEPAKAEALLEDLSDLFRHALIDQGASVTLAEEIALARRYLAIEQVRFGDRLRVAWSLDARADGARLPPLLLQPLVENAVRHGVEPAAGGGRVWVRAAVQRGQAVVTVSNTVPEEPSIPGHGMALHNVRERLRLVHDVAAGCEVTREATPAGELFQVRITLPLD